MEKPPDTGNSHSSDTDTTSPPDTGTADQQSHEPDTGVDTTDWRAEASKWQALAQKHEARAKSNADAAKELDRVRREGMSDTERAVAEATERARSEAIAEMRTRLGGRLVRQAVLLAVADRLTTEQVDALLARVDLASFVSDDGDVDDQAVTAWASTIAPAPTTTEPSFPQLGQGVRTPVANGRDNDPLLASLKGKLGITS